MSGRDSQNEREILEGIVTDTQRLISETRANRREWHELRQEVEAMFARGDMTRLTYDVHKERLRRSGQDIDCCLRSLERQMKIALQKLYGIGENG